jgi:hypothetical protein
MRRARIKIAALLALLSAAACSMDRSAAGAAPDELDNLIRRHDASAGDGVFELDQADAGELLEDAGPRVQGDGGAALPSSPSVDAGELQDAGDRDAGDAGRPPNACGGSAELEHAVGELCPGQFVGRCPDGRDCAIDAEYRCAGTERVACECNCLEASP